jgi:hypothetical protein
VEVQWVTPALPETWEGLSKLHQKASRLLGASGQEEEEEKEEVLTLGPVLADQEEPRIGLPRVAREAATSGGYHLRWSLLAKSSPKGEPPEAIRQVDHLLQGRQGLVETMTRALAAGGLPVAEYEIQFTLKQAQWDCRLLPRPVGEEMVDSPLLSICRSAAVEHIGYRLKDGVHGIDEFDITYLHEEQAYVALVLARGILKFSPENWLPFAEDIQELVISRFFVRREESP